MAAPKEILDLAPKLQMTGRETQTIDSETAIVPRAIAEGVDRGSEARERSAKRRAGVVFGCVPEAMAELFL